MCGSCHEKICLDRLRMWLVRLSASRYAQVMQERLRAIQTDVTEVIALHEFVQAEQADSLLKRYPHTSFVVDCIDSVEPKVQLICAARAAGIPVVSAMGAGGKVDPTQVQV